MRIIHVTRERPADRRFGIGRSLDPVIQAWRDAGHQVLYLTHEELGPRARAAGWWWWNHMVPRLRRWSGDALADLSMGWVERLNMGRLAAKVAAREQADAVHLHDPWMAWGFVVARQLSPNARRCRWGFSEHGFGSYADATREEGVVVGPAALRRLRRIEAAVARRADWVVCPTVAARHQLARDLALPAPAAHWHAVPHARPVLALPARDAARAALGRTGERWQVLAIGRDNPVKRLDRIVQACAMLERPVHLTLLGPEQRASFDVIAAAVPGGRLTLEVSVVDDVAPYLAAADVYVSVALNESFGLANLEALVAGLPSICTAVGGVPEVTGGAAWLLPPGDEALVSVLAAALDNLATHPELQRRLGLAARRQAQQWPDALQVAQRYEEIYRALAR